MRYREWVPSIILVIGVVVSGPAPAEDVARRTDHGDLIVLDVYGSYRDMGAQIAELLGADLRRVLELNLDFYERTRERGLGGWFFDRVLLPVSALFMSSDTGVAKEVAGYADALGISRAEILRGLIGTGAAGGSTVFAATRAATADGNALIGRNVDWIDFGGLLVPTVVRYHPDNGDFDYISAAWPMMQIPTVGLNERGLAFSLNYFATTPQSEPTAMSYPYRRVLQRATTVDEAIELFQSDFPIAIACFGALADADGNMALLECTTTECSVHRPEGDFFAHSNHARTKAMIARDEFRGPDSFDRKRLMEEAVRRHLGELDAQRAAEVLRSRAGHRHANASVVANLFVLNAAIVEPAKRILWHSDLEQPYAPFGRYVPIAIGDGEEGLEPIPASPLLSTDEHRREARAIAQVRAARNARYVGHDLDRGIALWAEVFRDPSAQLDRAELSIGYSEALLHAGRFEDAVAVLDAWVGPEASWEVHLHAALLTGACADGRGDRESALEQYAVALARIEERPDYTAYEALRELATEGLERALAPAEVNLGPWVTHVPP